MNQERVAAFLETIVDGQEERFQLELDSICHIGRDPQNTIVLADNQVSRKHAMVQCAQTGRCHLTDLGSRNGTFVNQRRVAAPVALQSGDRISIGSREFVYHGSCKPDTAPGLESSETVVDFAERLITVLVLDIRDFTGLSRRLPEARLSEVISTFFRDSGTVLSQQGAWAQKYIGDAVMAFWLHQAGQPALPDIVSVFEALSRIFDIAAGLQSQFGLDAPIRIGAGINTGPACVGNMGSEAAADYTALSDAVNLSFRIESATKEIGCDLALGPATHEFIAGQVPADEHFKLHTMLLKGYREPKDVYGTTAAAARILLDEMRRKLHDGATEETRHA